MMVRTYGLALYAFVCFASPAVGDPPTGFRQQVFNGHDLQGWQVLGCRAVADQGKLILQDGDGTVRTDCRYSNFVLELKWRPLRKKGWDSGIYFHCELPPSGQPWPARYQINLAQGHEGNVVGVAAAQSKGLVLPGVWNQFRLTVIGKSATLEINGQRAWQIDALETASGYVALQSEVAGGGQFEFKDIFVTELDHRSMFNGKDLTGWEGAGQPAERCWKVADALLVCTGDKGPWLRSEKQFDDFNLRLEYRLRDGGNSGVYVRVPEDGNHHGRGAGVEVQILDDHAERYRELKPWQYCGSVYKIAAAGPKVGRPAGQWNTMEINCVGQHYQVRHNGITIVDARLEQFPELGERRLQGFLGFQNHSEEVWFRAIRVGPPFPH